MTMRTEYIFICSPSSRYHYYSWIASFIFFLGFQVSGVASYLDNGILNLANRHKYLHGVRAKCNWPYREDPRLTLCRRRKHLLFTAFEVSKMRLLQRKHTSHDRMIKLCPEASAPIFYPKYGLANPIFHHGASHASTSLSQSSTASAATSFFFFNTLLLPSTVNALLAPTLACGTVLEAEAPFAT